MNPNIRIVNQADCDELEEMTREAFWNLYQPGCDEHFLVRKILDHKDYLNDLSFVAEQDGKITGVLLTTKSCVSNNKNEIIETITFGPLNGKDFGVSDAEGRFPQGLLVLELISGAFGNDTWFFQESDVYQIDPKEFEKFENSLQPKEKKYCHTQDLFQMLVRSYLID